MTGTNSFSYRLFGFHLESDLEIPELQRLNGDCAVDAVVRLGEVTADASSTAGPHPIVGGAVFAIPEVARYAVLDGHRIIVDPAAGADPRNVRLYLLGSAMGLLLHQRGVLPLHANAVQIDGRAVAFMGPSGAGKSTLAAWLHDRGLRILADDVCAVRFDGKSKALVSEGLPRLRLWKSALEATGRETVGFDRSYAGDEQWDKFDVPLGQGRIEDPLPLGAIYLLEQGDELAIRPLNGLAAAEAIYANTYRGQHIDGADQARAHWESCLKVVAGTPIFSLVRRWGFSDFDDQVSLIVSHARDVGRDCAGKS